MRAFEQDRTGPGGSRQSPRRLRRPQVGLQRRHIYCVRHSARRPFRISPSLQLAEVHEDVLRFLARNAPAPQRRQLLRRSIGTRWTTTALAFPGGDLKAAAAAFEKSHRGRPAKSRRLDHLGPWCGAVGIPRRARRKLLGEFPGDRPRGWHGLNFFYAAPSGRWRLTTAR